MSLKNSIFNFQSVRTATTCNYPENDQLWVLVISKIIIITPKDHSKHYYCHQPLTILINISLVSACKFIMEIVKGKPTSVQQQKSAGEVEGR